jgi:hypothetical protein
MRAKSAWTVTFVLGLCLVVLVVAIHIADGALREGYFSADHVYIATLFEDLTRWGGHFSEWNFTPAPYFFPDMFLYGVVRALVFSVEAAQYCTDTLQLLLIIVAARELLKRALPDRAMESSLVAMFFPPWILLHYLERHAFIGPTMITASHGGGLLSTLVVFTLCLRPQTRQRLTGTLAVVLFSALTATSDALFFVSCSLPLAATALCYAPLAIWRRSHVGPWARLSITRCVLGATSGAAGLWFSRAYGLAHTGIQGGSAELAVQTWEQIIESPDSGAEYTLVALSCAAILAVLVMVRTRREPHRAGLRLLAFWQLAVTGAVVGAFLYNGSYFDRWTLRYLVTPCNLALVLVAAMAILAVGRAPGDERPNHWPTRVAALATIALIFGVATQASGLIKIQYIAPQRAAAECIADVAEREGVTGILAEYWVAKPVMLLSEGRAHIIQVMPRSLRPNFWISSRGWFRGPLAIGMLVTNGLDMVEVGQKFGLPQAVAQCGTYRVFVYQGAPRVHMTFRMQAAIDRELVTVDAQRRLGWDRETAAWFGAQSSR